jgi:hypothetical protein
MKYMYGVLVLLMVLLSAAFATAQQTPQSLVRVSALGETRDTCSCRCGQSEFQAIPLSTLVEESQNTEIEKQTKLMIRSGVIKGAQGEMTVELRRPRFVTELPVIVFGQVAAEQDCPNCDIVGWLRCMEGCERFDWCEGLCDALHSCCPQG